MSRLVAVAAATTVIVSLSATAPAAYAAEQQSPASGHNVDTVSGTGHGTAAVASSRSTAAPSTRAQRQAVVKVTRSKVKGKKRYTVSLSAFVGDVYLKWGMSNKSWRWQRTSVDQSVSFRAAKPVTWVTVRAEGYVPLTKRKVSGKSWATRLSSTGKPLPWEVDGDASMHEFAVPFGLGGLTPMRWDPCTYTYSAPSGCQRLMGLVVVS